MSRSGCSEGDVTRQVQVVLCHGDATEEGDATDSDAGADGQLAHAGKAFGRVPGCADDGGADERELVIIS